MAVLSGIVVWLWMANQPSPVRSAFDKIQVGMTRDEVEAILNEAGVDSYFFAENYHGNSVLISLDNRDTFLEHPSWWDEFAVDFTKKGGVARVTSKEFYPANRAQWAWDWLRRKIRVALNP
jgi:hypothetical protein